MEDLIASVRVGTRVRIHGCPYVCLSRFAFDRWDDMFVLHDLRLPLDHRASLKTMLECTLNDLNRLGCVRLDGDDGGAPPPNAVSFPPVAPSAGQFIPAS